MRSNLNTPDKKVERYFKTLDTCISPLPKNKRNEIQQEIRQHFEALVSDHEEAGLSQENAILSALLEMGSAEKLGNELHYQWLLSRPNSVHIFNTLFFTFGIYSYAWFPIAFVLYWIAAYEPQFYTSVSEILACTLLITPHILAGLTFGWMYPKRAKVLLPWVIAVWVYCIWISAGWPAQFLLTQSHWEKIVTPLIAVVISLTSALAASHTSHSVRKRIPAWIQVFNTNP